MEVDKGDSVMVSLLFGVLFGLASLGGASAALVIPAAGDAFGRPDSDITWMITLYVLLLAVMNPLYGRIADLHGIRTPLVTGVVLMATGAMVATLAPTFAVLLMARVLQGAGAAAVPTLCVTLVNGRYAGVVRSAALGRLTAVATAVTCLGPLAGGLVEHLNSWRAVLALPTLGLVALPMVWRVLEVGGIRAPLDLVGGTLVALVSTGFVLLVQSPSAGVVVAVAGAALMVVATPLLALRVRRRPSGFLPSAVILNSTAVRAAAAAMPIPAGWFAILIATPAVLIPRGWEPWEVGLLLLPSGIGALFVPRFVGSVIGRLGARGTLCLVALMTSTAIGIAALSVELSWSFGLGLAAATVAVAFGFGQPAMVAAVSDAVTVDVRGVALGLATMTFMVGGSVGSAFLAGFSPTVTLAGALGLLVLLPLVGLVALVRPFGAGLPMSVRAPSAPTPTT